MRLTKAWVVATKDLATFARRKSVLYSLVVFPVFVAVGLPFITKLIDGNTAGTGIPVSVLDSFGFFLVIGAASIPLGIASYALVGEKVQKSLEPLLATPTTDGEILLGKCLACFLPTILAIYLGAALFMGLMDRVTYASLGDDAFPNPIMDVMLGLVAPLACLLSIEANVVISAWASDVRTAQQTGSLILLPFAAIYIASETNLLPLSVAGMLELAGLLAAIDLALFAVARAVFQREQILTRWK